MAQSDWQGVRAQIDAEWDTSIVPALSEYIRVPNTSPEFDPEWATNGLLRRAMDVLVQWVHVQKIAGMRYEVMNETGRTPFLIIEIDPFVGCPVDDKHGGQVMPPHGATKHDDKSEAKHAHGEKHAHHDKEAKHADDKHKHAEKADKHAEKAEKHADDKHKHADDKHKHAEKEAKHSEKEEKHAAVADAHAAEKHKHADDKHKHTEKEEKHAEKADKHAEKAEKHADDKHKHADDKHKHAEKEAKHAEKEEKHAAVADAHAAEKHKHGEKEAKDAKKAEKEQKEEQHKKHEAEEKQQREAREQREKEAARERSHADAERREREAENAEHDRKVQEVERKTEHHLEKREKTGAIVFATNAPVETAEQYHHETRDKYAKHIHKHGVLMYGHMDKQPATQPWSSGLDPHVPTYRDGKLYGRGGADDGYSVFSALTAVAAMQHNGIPHSRIVIIIEGAEESGSGDLPYYLQQLRGRIGDIDLVVCLNSGAKNYEQLWVTSALRGMIGGTLRVDAKKSDAQGGVVPDSMAVAQTLIDRLKDSKTGNVTLPHVNEPIPDRFHTEVQGMTATGAEAPRSAAAVAPPQHATATATSTTATIIERRKLQGGVWAGDTTIELTEGHYWQPTLFVDRRENVPVVTAGGNTIESSGSSVKVSLSLPPHVDAAKASKALKDALTSDPPQGAHVEFVPDEPSAGWTAPMLQQWLVVALDFASKEYWGQTNGTVGLGAAMPFMTMLSHTFPKAQYFVTGALGPQSNAHSADECLNVPYAKGITYSVARVVAAHAVCK